MGQMSAGEWNEIGDAIVIWTGRSVSNCPDRSEERLVAKFGTQRVAEMLPVIRALEDDVYSSNARFTAHDLSEMYKMVIEEFRWKYPLLPKVALEAFAWCYTFDYR